MGERKVTILTYDCPGCGATVKIDPNQKMATCEYCGTSFSIETETPPPPPNPGPAVNTAYNGPRINAEEMRRRQKKNVTIAVTIIVVVLVAMCGVPTLFAGILALADISSGSHTQTASVKEADPFANIYVCIDGMEPWATVEYVRNDSNLSGIRYSVDKKKGLSNGDVITIEAEQMSGYQWTNSTYEYTVSGLDTVVENVAQLSEEHQELLYNEVKQEIETHWENNLDYIDASLENLHVDVKPYKIYISVYKDGENNSFFDKNTVCPAFETTFEVDGKSFTVYQFGKIDNVYLSPDGTIHGDFDSMQTSLGYIYSDSLVVNKSFSIWGYESIIKMESAMEDENYRLVK